MNGEISIRNHIQEQAALMVLGTPVRSAMPIRHRQVLPMVLEKITFLTMEPGR